MSGNGIGPYGSLPSDLDPHDDDVTLNPANWTDADWDNAEMWYGFDPPQGFPNYLPTAVDPGQAVTVFVVVYTLALMVALPVLVVLGRRWEATKKERAAAAAAAAAKADSHENVE